MAVGNCKPKEELPLTNHHHHDHTSQTQVTKTFQSLSFFFYLLPLTPDFEDLLSLAWIPSYLSVLNNFGRQLKGMHSIHFSKYFFLKKKYNIHNQS